MYSDRYSDWRVKAFRENYLRSIARSEMDNAEKMKKLQAQQSTESKKASKEIPKEQNNEKNLKEIRNETQSQRITRLREEKYAKEAPKLKGTKQQTPSQKDRADYEKIRHAKEQEGSTYSLEQHKEAKAKTDFHKGQYDGQRREMQRGLHKNQSSRTAIARHNGKTYVKRSPSQSKQVPDRSAIKSQSPSQSKGHQHARPQVVKVGNKTFVRNASDHKRSQQQKTPDRSAIKSQGKEQPQQKRPEKSPPPKSRDRER